MIPILILILDAVARLFRSIVDRLTGMLAARQKMSISRRLLRWLAERALREVDNANMAKWLGAGAPGEKVGIPRQLMKELLAINERAMRDYTRQAMAAFRKRGDRSVLSVARGLYQKAGAWARATAGLTNSKLNEARAKQTGSVGYYWQRTRSANPRDEHLSRVGRFFEWGEVEDEPGVAFGCKCGARPVFER